MNKIFVCLVVFIIAVLGLRAQNGDFERRTMIYEDTLALDLFLPNIKNTDPRPVLIYVHGGGFAGGTRDYKNHIWFCEYFAKKGWITATISYHLKMKGKSFSCDQNVQNKINTIFAAAQNVNQATAFLLSNKEKYQIDLERIVIAGSSAGAEAVIHSAYWEKTQMDILDPTFKYAGVISMAGALLDENWITKESAIPTALFHGTCDNLVPYATASHHYCEVGKPGFMMLFGSESIAMKLESLNKGYYLVSGCGGGHEWNEKPIRPAYVSLIDDFLTEDVLAGRQRQNHQVFHEGKESCDSGFANCTD
ncbi:MAG: putative esterase [Cyclobacteriaceae bacterium]|jgi:predicted esterase